MLKKRSFLVVLAVAVTILSGMTTQALTCQSLSQASESIGAIAQIQHNNGALVTLNGEPLPYAGEYFPVEAGDTIEIGRGYTQFTLQMASPDTVLWTIQIFPGDRFASFSLEDYLVNTDQPFSDTSTLASGRVDVIAYGFDPEHPYPIVLTAVDSVSTSEP
ncbi:hypothetical protein C7271_15355 [filamentous cyanobacterium CCP5]|nr:hypothetical protein C7271_15355 [filamentous cyanobacterium CCP5]